MTAFNRISFNTILLLLILVVAAMLRFWNFAHLPYMHDELSALGRTQYNSVQDVITFGTTINDTHPPGIQVFLYYWTRLFGTSEMIVKLPFLICGLFTVVLVYKISKSWFNPSVGLVASAFVAVMQYMVMYSQLARPYSTGVFFCLLLVYCWSKFLFVSPYQKKWLIGYVLSAVCCAYNHHFALLFAFIVGLSGIPFLTKNNWKPYFLSGILICLLYLPNVQILLFQLSKGGLGGAGGWLGPPDSGWLYRYLKYIFHFSYWMYGLAFTVILLSVIWYNKEISKTNKFRVLCIVWFFSFFFIQYFYSIYVSAILQFSTLIFAFPFLLIFFFSLFSELSIKKNALLVVFILGVGTVSLAKERKHFQVFYKQPFQQHVKVTEEMLHKINDPKDVTVKIFVPFYLRSFLKKHYLKGRTTMFNESFYCIQANYPTAKMFRSFVYSQPTHYFIAGDLPVDYIQIIKEKYPYIMSKEEGFTYSIYCFAKEKPQVEIKEEVMFEKQLVFDKNTMDSTEEYGQLFLFKLKDILYSRHAEAIISVELLTTDTLSEPLLVGSLEENSQYVEWRGAKYSNFNNNNKQQLNRVILTVPFTSFDFIKHPDAELRTFVWNKDKKKLQLGQMRVEVIRSNPIIYGLYEPLD